MQLSKSLFWTSISCMLVLVMCAVFLIVQKKSLEKALSAAVQNAHEHNYKKQLAETKVGTLETYLMLSVESNKKSITDNVSLTDMKNNKRSAAEAFAGKTPYLVFRYSYSDCAPCIDTVFKYLWELKNNVDPNKLQIAVIPNDIELKQKLEQDTLSFKNQFTFYMTDGNGLGLPIDKVWLPYLLIVDENKYTNHVFIVDKMFQPLLEKYFEVIAERYE